jgi:hypothetical protein
MAEEVKVEKESSGRTAPKRFNRYQSRGASVGTAECKFEGRCEDLKGFVFDFTDGKNADIYNLSMKEIAEYGGRTYTYGGDLKFTVESEEKFTLPKPTKVEVDQLDATHKQIWEKRIDEYVKLDMKLNENCQNLYSLIWGQCTEYMRAKLEAVVGYDKMRTSLNVIRLIKSIKGLTYKFEGQNYHPRELH